MAAQANIDSETVHEREAITFVKWTLEEVCQDSGNLYCDPSKVIDDMVTDTGEGFRGTVGEYVDFLNEKERYFNQFGQSLRDEGILPAGRIPTSVEDLKEAFLEALKINGPETLAKIIGNGSVDNCELIPSIGSNIENPNGRIRIDLPDYGRLDLNDVINRVNDQQKILCSLGFSIFDIVPLNLNQDPRVVFKRLIEVRNELINELGLDQYDALFSMEGFEEVKKYADLAKDIDELLKAKKFPSPEQIFELKDKLNAVLPADLQIPDLPSIPRPSPPDFSYLDLKKRKEWDGFNIGRQDRFAAVSNAYLEIRGDRTEQAATAEGFASIYILNQELNVIGGYGYFHAAPTKLDGELKLKVLGQDVFEPKKFEESLEIKIAEPELFRWDFDKSYSQTFFVGPVPVTVALGGRANLKLGYEVGITFMSLNGRLIPSAAAEAYAQVVAGIPGLLAVGAEANVTLIDIKVPLTGSANIFFDEVGAPMLDLSITANANYTTLKGRAFAYVEYPKPRVGIPPWKRKRAEKELFAFEGNTVNHSIMNWGIEIGRFGSKIRGDLIDQSDRKEAEAIAAEVKLNLRKEKMEKYREELGQRANTIFTVIGEDFTSVANTTLVAVVEKNGEARDQFDDNILKFREDVATNSGI